MFIYTENDTGSYKFISNNNSYYKTHQQHLNTFPYIHFIFFPNLDYHLNQRFSLICIARFGGLEILVYTYIYIYIYIYVYIYTERVNNNDIYIYSYTYIYVYIYTHIYICSPNRACSMGVWRLFKVGQGHPAARASALAKIMSFEDVVQTSTRLTPLETAAGRLLDHARCSHSNIFEPHVASISWKLAESKPEVNQKLDSRWCPKGNGRHFCKYIKK